MVTNEFGLPIMPTVALHMVHSALDACLVDVPWWVGVWGEAGSGKTTAVNAWRSEHPEIRSLMVDCPSAGTWRSLAKEIYAQLRGVEEELETVVYERRIEAELGTFLMIVIDECQRLEGRAFDGIRRVFDRHPKTVRLVFVGGPDAKRNVLNKPMAFSRVATPVEFGRLQPEEARQVLPTYVPDVFAVDLDLTEQVARVLKGSLRRLTQFAQHCRNIMRTKEHPMDKDVAAAALMRMGYSKSSETRTGWSAPVEEEETAAA